MPITVVYEDEGGWPIIRCDWCHQQIEDVEQGNVYWLHDLPAALYFNHKRCASAHDRDLEALAREHNTVLLSEHLEVFLAQLLGNTGREEAVPVIDKNRLS